MAMTPQEHRLMISLIAKQLQQISVLLEIMKSRGLLEGDDPLAFATVVHSDRATSERVLRTAEELYRQAAKVEGVEIDLENPA